MAKCSRGTPRIANRILRRMRDLVQVWGTGAIDGDIVRRGLESLEIDREILRTIVQKYGCGPVATSGRPWTPSKTYTSRS